MISVLADGSCVHRIHTKVVRPIRQTKSTTARSRSKKLKQYSEKFRNISVWQHSTIIVFVCMAEQVESGNSGKSR